MINLAQGLVNSLIVLELLRGKDSLKDIDIFVSTFTNLREAGLTFSIGIGTKLFTWCVYEFRSDDSITVNGTDKHYCGALGELPYDGKKSCIKGFRYGQYHKVADFLESEFIKFCKGASND